MAGQEKPVISVIVPVYRVEPFLRRCLDSLAGQTYRRLEIILVDDGSPDGCPAICDEYAARDGRFRVIHKENGGVSSARNAGLDAASGEWIGFVDSDDWIEPDMYEYLLENALRCGAELARCGLYRVGEDGKREFYGVAEPLVLRRELAGEQTFDSDMWNSCWNMISRRSLWEGVRFPERVRIGEDAVVICRLLLAARTALVLPGAKYCYLQRPGSAMHAGSFDGWLDGFHAYEDRYRLLAERYPLLEEQLLASCVRLAGHVWGAFHRAPPARQKEAGPELKHISAFLRPHLGMAFRRGGLNWKERLALCLAVRPAGWAFAAAGLAEELADRLGR